MRDGGIDDLPTDKLRLVIARWNRVLDALAELRASDGLAAELIDVLEEHVHDMLDELDGRTVQLDPEARFVSLEEMESRLGLS